MITSLTTANIKELIAILKAREENEEAIASLTAELARRTAEDSLKSYRDKKYVAYLYSRAEAAHRHDICSYYDTCDCADCV